MKCKTGRRIISMVLAAQLPLSTAAQAAAPLMTSVADQDTQSQRPISFQDFLRIEEANAGRYALFQEPMWQKLRLVTSVGENGTDTTPDSTAAATPAPSADQSSQTSTPVEPVPDGTQEEEESQPSTPVPEPVPDSNDNVDTLTSDGEAGDAAQPSVPGDDIDTPAPDAGDDTNDQPTDPVGDTDKQTPADGEEDEKSDLPTGDDTDPQNPDDGERGDGEEGETPAVSDPTDDNGTPPSPEGKPEDAVMSTPADSAAQAEQSDLFSARVVYPYSAILKIGGYGDYGIGFAVNGDAVWGSSKYNLEWPGKTWAYGISSSDGNYDQDGIFTEGFGSGKLATDEFGDPILDDETGYYAFEISPWYDLSHYINYNEFVSGNRILNSFTAELPRLPNKEFDGWYIQKSGSGYDNSSVNYFDGIIPFEEDFGPGNLYAHEGTTNGVTTTIAIPGVDDQIPFDPTANMEQYLDHAIDSEYGDMSLLPVIGVWKDSTNATATGLKVTTVASGNEEEEISTFRVYDPDLLTMTNDELKSAATTTFATGTDKYFIRVPFDVQKLNFDFTTFEPGSTVVVKNTYKGQTIVYNDSLIGKDTTMTYEDGDYKDYDVDNPHNPTNTPEDDPNAGVRGYEGTGPARKVFTLGTETTPVYIDLGVYNASSANTCNVITFTVTAPDGKTSKDYTLYIQRLDDPTMDKDPGNTPYGMIWREWPDDTEKRSAAIADFASNEGGEPNTFKNTVFESVALNNGGYIYKGRYRNMAWVPGTTNLDHEKTAIVVYTNSTFQIPDATVIDGLGVPHRASEYNVTWELSLTQVETMGPEIATDDALGTPVLMKREDSDTVTLPANIKPGIYTLSYTYTDPYDGARHSDEDHGFSRQIVILPLPGDVDMDGTVTAADGVKLGELLEDGFFDNMESETMTDAVKRLYYYRVCNVDNRNHLVDVADVALLTGDFETPAYSTTKEAGDYYMYLPLTTETVHRRPAVKTEGKTQLSVEYLGIENSETKALDPTLRPDYDPQNITPFWMGVRLIGEAPQCLTGDVTTWTFTLIYDPTYVTPWAPEGADDLMSYILSENELWSGYTLLPSSGSDITPATHLESKATPAIAGREANLREIRFSVQGSGADLSKLTDGLLLKVPFQLKAYPGSLMDRDGNAVLVDASLGTRDFVVTTTTGASVWNNAERAPNAGTINLATSLTYTGTAQIPIGENKAPGTPVLDRDGNNPVYGDEFSANLPDETNQINIADNDILDATKLPPGITYNWQHKTLTGTPTQAGTYTFIVQSGISSGNITQYEFQITVDKAPLNLTVQNVDMYYGQNPRQNGATTAQTFTYDPEQIKAIDVTDGKTNGGTAAELATLLNKTNDDYGAPEISLRTTQAVDGAEVTATTVPGSYWVMMESGGSRNYKFYYVQPASGDTEEKISPDFGWATLTVNPRPVLVDKLNKEPLGEILVSATSNQIEGNTASYLTHEFDVTSPAVSGAYNDIPLSASTTIANGDQVVLDYTVIVEDLNQIKLTKKEELHDAKVADVKLAKTAETNRNNCYVLVNPNASEITGHPKEDGWVRPTNQEGKALVKAQELSNLEAQWNSPAEKPDSNRVYTYGETLALDHLSVSLTYLDAQGKPEETPISFFGEFWTQGVNGGVAQLYRDRGIAIQWVDSNGAKPAEITAESLTTSAYTDMAYTGQQISVKDHNDKWLCISAPGTDLKPIYIGPFTVNKKTLTIKVNPLKRYYGEQNPAFGYRYETADLAGWDRYEGMRDDSSTLKQQLANYNYEEPVYKYSTVNNSLTEGEDVTAATGIGTRYMLVYGAKCDNYSFRYQLVDADTKEVLATSAVSEDPDSPEEQAAPILGYATLTILKRPILVTQIQGPVGTILFDSSTNVIEDLKASAEKIEAELPEKNIPYYQWGRHEAAVTYPEPGLTLEGDAICAGDRVTVKFQATFEKQNNSVPFWNLDDKSSLDVTVAIEKLDLMAAEGQGSNYELVFAGSAPAASGWTAKRDPSKPGGYDRTDSTGTVVKRSLGGIQVIASPKLGYTYGGAGESGMGTLDLSTLQVKITYADDTTEDVTYSLALSGQVETNTFAQKGMTVHWDSADGPEAKNGERLTVTDYNNRQLVITGQATPNDPVQVATLAPGVGMTVTVAKRALVLKATDQTRAYGENNGTYRFTFDPSTLAEWDAKLLADRNLKAEGSAAALDTAATSSALSAIDPTFKGPTFDTDAAKNSNVGDYRLYLDSDGSSMANYRLRFENATIHVVERPVYVTEIKKSPLNSVHVGASTETKYKTVGYVGGSGAEAKTDFALSIFNDSSSGLTFEGNNALVGDDVLEISIDFNYANTSAVTSAAPVRINDLTLVENADSKNYTLVAGRSTIVGNNFNLGEVHEKRITKIEPFGQPNLTFTYGDKLLQLADLGIRVTYEDNTTSTYNVGNFSLADAYYYNSASVPAKSEWEKIPTTYTKVQNNDHLTVNGHNGKYILVLAKVSNETGAGYVAPIILRNNSSSNGAIQVNPRPLTYTFTAADKVYDTTTVTTGTIHLTNVYGNDKIWVDNGTDYTNQELGNYTFASGESGIRFTYTSPNAGEGIVVRVDGIKLIGPDKDNYDIGPATVTSTESGINGRDGAPKATITKADRTAMHVQAPDVQISLTVDEHTNAVAVSVDRRASTFGNTADRLNSQLHYEYQLVRLNPDGTVALTTNWQDSPYFGGELIGDGSAQDGDIGTEPSLPRGQYMMANVRLCETGNYKASALTNSITGSSDLPTAAVVQEAVAAAEQAVADAAAAVTDDKIRTVERVPGPVTWTYTYRVDLYDSTEVKGEGDTVFYTTTLVDVWFTDITAYNEQRTFERLVGNLTQSLYTGYFWDEAKKVALTYGASFDLSQDIMVKLSVEQEDGTTAEEEKLVNPANPLGGRDLTVYVTSVPRADDTPSLKTIEIIPAELTARPGDEPVQLELKLTPKSASSRNLRWSSSDPAVATVDKNGLVTFVGPGIAVITVQTRSGSVSATMTVRVMGDYPYEGAMLNVYYTDAYMDLFPGEIFAPELTMSRQTMITIMARVFQTTERKVPKPLANIYDDVPGGASYLEQLDRLDTWGIINGIGDNLFAPDDTATRAEAAVVLCQMLMLPVGTDPNAPHAFTDATPENHWAWAYIDALAAAGITVGTGGGCYSPDDPVTRAELATFIAKTLATEADTKAPDLIRPLDVTSEHWAHKYVLRAVNSGTMLCWKENI